MEYSYREQQERVERAANLLRQAQSLLSECKWYDRNHGADGDEYSELVNLVAGATGVVEGFSAALEASCQDAESATK